MEFRFTPEQQQFRAEVRGVIKNELPANLDELGDGEGGSDATWQVAKQFTAKLADRKWLAMAWPKEFGGLEADHMTQMIYNEELAYNRAPTTGNMGLAWVGPAIMLYGTQEQKDKFIPRIVNAADEWCTLYSEPGAGSDLASLQTRAVKDGDDYVINGQKIWTSGAHRSNWGWLAARTDPDAPKHRGITTFVVPMDSPGITIRPLINIAGQHGFNEVFFDNVRIPKENLVGTEHRGWYQVAVALDYERSGIGAYAGGRRTLEEMTEFARSNRQLWNRNPNVRMELAERAIEVATGTIIAYRIPYMQSKGKIPNHEASMSKLFGSEMSQRIASTGIKILGLYGNVAPGTRYSYMKGRLEQMYLTSVSSTIAAGTSEIQRGIIATRGLGLPRG